MVLQLNVLMLFCIIVILKNHIVEVEPSHPATKTIQLLKMHNAGGEGVFLHALWKH